LTENGGANYSRTLRRISASGQVDPSFGTNGSIVLSRCSGCEIAVDELNHLYVFSPGLDPIGVPAIYVTRYSSDGVVDSSYGTAGRAYFNTTTFQMVSVGRQGSVAIVDAINPRVAMISADGKNVNVVATNHCSVVYGGAFDSVGRFLFLSGRCTPIAPSGSTYVQSVFRLTASGLDSAFDTDGVANVPGTNGLANRLLVDSANRPLVFSDRSVLRMTTAGSPDGSYHNGTAATLPETGGRTQATAVAINTNDEVFGIVHTPSGQYNEDFAISKLLASGQPDPQFGIGGVVVPSVFAGPLTSTFGMAPFNSPILMTSGSGVLISSSVQATDPSFGPLIANGFARLDGQGAAVSGYGSNSVLALRDAPLMLPVGATWPGPNGSVYVSFERDRGVGVVLARFAASGGLDTSFSGDGLIVDPLATSVTVDPTGRPAFFRVTVSAGTLSFGMQTGPTARSAARFTTTGSPDPTFGGGTVTWPELTLPAGATSYCDALLTATSDGAIVVAYGPAGGVAECSTTGLDRISATGVLTQGWAPAMSSLAGTRVVKTTAAASNGRTVVLLATPGAQDSRMVRLTPAGDIDSGFGSAGVINIGDSGSSQLGVLNDDSVVVSATSGSANSFSAGGIDIRRFLVDGTPVTTGGFGATGRMHSTGTQRTTVAGSHIVTAGFNADAGVDSTEGFVLAARSDGAAETSFPRLGDDGRADFASNFSVLHYPVVSGQRAFVASLSITGVVEIRKFSGTLS